MVKGMKPDLKKLLLIFATATAAFAFQTNPSAQAARWEQEARNVTIVRDDWGIAHVYGKTDADAVFGMDIRPGRRRLQSRRDQLHQRHGTAGGGRRRVQDLSGPAHEAVHRSGELKKQYAASPAWLQTLMDAFADGLNYYLSKHPEVKPRVIKHFEPWMALSFTEGSIGGDIERVNLDQLEAFYGKAPGAGAAWRPAEDREPEPGGSNGMAIAPSNTADHHALLLINPHTSFFFRSELQMASDEGLNAYGAVTWGQFFIYQGFNDRAGWMHTIERRGRHRRVSGNRDQEGRPLLL